MIIPKLKAVIVEDEVLNIETLDKIVTTYCSDVLVVARCQNPAEAVAIVHELKPDIVFLDINMPEMNGFDFLNQFDKIHFKIIFTTAFSQYGIKAVKYAAFDYLLKPISPKEVVEAVRKVKEAILEKPISITSGKRTKTNLALPTAEGLLFIDVFDIIYCKSDGSYTTFILEEGVQYVVSRGLSETTDMLEIHDFFRIHQSYLVNGKFIKKYNKHNHFITLRNGVELPVSIRKKEEFLQFVAKL